MKQVSVSMIGSGFAARLHGNAFRLVSRLEVRLRACCDLREDTAKVLAEEYGYEVCTTDYRQILQDPETDVVFVCTPPRFHAGMAAEALRAGKHVVCEKPLTGYFGPPGSQELIGRTVPKREMFRSVLAELERLEAVVKESGRRFMYAENYVYTPCIQRAAEFLRAKGSTITYMRGEETVQGSPHCRRRTLAQHRRRKPAADWLPSLGWDFVPQERGSGCQRPSSLRGKHSSRYGDAQRWDSRGGKTAPPRTAPGCGGFWYDNPDVFRQYKSHDFCQ